MRKTAKIISIILSVALLFETQMVKVTASEVETNELICLEDEEPELLQRYDAFPYRPYPEATYQLQFVYIDDYTVSLQDVRGTPGGILVIPGKVIDPDGNEVSIVEIKNVQSHNNLHEESFTGNLVIPDSVKKIGDSAFGSNCYEMEGSLTLGSGVEVIGGAAFADLNFSGPLSIPNSVKEIGYSAFYNCDKLDGLFTFGNSVETIGEEAFKNCSGMYGTLTLPNSAKKIGKSAFYNCEKLYGSLTIPGTVKKVDDQAFMNCSGMSGTLTICSGVQSIGNYAFNGTGFSKIVLEEGITGIGEYAFDSPNIEELVIPQSFKTKIFNSEPAIWSMIGFTCSSLKKVVNKSTVETGLPRSYWTTNEKGESIRIPVTWKNAANGKTITSISNGTAIRNDYENDPGEDEDDFDFWGFSNTENNYGDPTNGYCISKADYNRLLSNLPATAKADMENNYNIDGTGTVVSEWGGSCYGMSTSTLRVNDTKDSVSDYALGSKIVKLNDVKAADDQFKKNGKDSVGKAESVINFYHYQQLLPEYQNVRKTFASYTGKEQITAVSELAKTASSNKTPAVVDLWWWDEGEISGHTINAIGYRELTSSDALYASYPHCILTYDCSNPDDTGDNSDYNIYFDDEGNWTVPGWEVTPDNAYYICGSGDANIVGPVDYKTGTYAKTAEIPASISYDGDDEAWQLQWDENSVEIDGGSITENIANDDNVTILPEMTDQVENEYRAYIPEDKDYKIVGEQLDHTIRSDDKSVHIEAENGGTAELKQDGSVSVNSDTNGQIAITIIQNGENTLYVSTEGENLKLEETENGIKISSDDLTDITIQNGTNKTIIHSDENQILVTPKDDGTIDVFEDKDGDEVFDDEIKITAVGFSHSVIPDQTYTGKAIVPNVQVYHEDTLLKQGVDYVIKFTNNVNAGNNATLTITGKGNFSGRETDTFKIVAKNIGDEDVVATEIASIAHDKKEHKPVPVMTYNGKKLAVNKDFTVVYYTNDTCTGNTVIPKGNGRYYAKVVGIKDFKGQKILPFDIAAANQIPVSKLTVAKVPAVQYTGSQIMPKPVIKSGKTPLTENTHFTLTYGANTEVGVGTVKITGKEPYVGTKTVTFNITGIPIAKAAVTCAKETYIYDGTEKTQSVTSITYNKGITNIPFCTEEAYKALALDQQKKIGCVISYKNNVEAGKATMVLRGIHQCTGTATKTFNITPYNVTADTGHAFEVSLDQTEYPFAKGTVKPKPTVTFKGEPLKEGVDYTLSYTNNKAVNDGTKPRSVPTVKVTGKKNFAGEKTATFKIIAAKMQDVGIKVVANDVVYADKNGNWKTKLNLIDAEGKVLKANADYDLKNAEYHFGDETGELLTDGHKLSAGDAVYVRVPAKGASYTGYAEGTYRISRLDISKLNATIAPKTYTGKTVTLTNADIVWKKVSNQADVTYIFDETSYKNNISKGKATVSIIGTGNYCGRKTLTFTIGAKGIVWWWNDLKN